MNRRRGRSASVAPARPGCGVGDFSPVLKADGPRGEQEETEGEAGDQEHGVTPRQDKTDQGQDPEGLAPADLARDERQDEGADDAAGRRMVRTMKLSSPT